MRSCKTLTVADVAHRIAELKNVAVAVHRSPDADAIGSAAALVFSIEAMGGKAVVLSADGVPEAISFLAEGVTVTDVPPEGAALIAVDVASPQQLGELIEYKDSFVLMVDHHSKGEPFADNLVEPHAAAAGEIVYKIVCELMEKGKLAPPPRVWDSVFAAISGDTGSFRFGNTTADTHRIAAELLAHGARHEYISHNLHSVKTKRAVMAERIALTNMTFHREGKAVVTAVSHSEMMAASLRNEDFSDVSDKMRSVSGALVGVAMRENEPGVWRVSLRANVPVDCASVAVSLGGGGHTQAAGCSITAADAEGAKAVLLPKIEKAIAEYERTK